MTRQNLLNFALFQLVWLGAVWGASWENLWLGPLALLAFLALHLEMIPAGPERRREVAYFVGVGLVGSLADTILHAIGATAYPTSSETWPFLVVPPWILSLWVAFALLPRFSLAWLAGRPLLAIAFGAVGGPLSYFAGTRFGSVAVGENSLLTWSALAVEYAVVTPLLLHFAPGTRDEDVRAKDRTRPAPPTQARTAGGADAQA